MPCTYRATFRPNPNPPRSHRTAPQEDASPIFGAGEPAAKFRKVALPLMRQVLLERIPVRRPVGALNPEVVQVLQQVRAASKGQLNASIGGALLHNQLLCCPAAQPEAGGASGA